MSKKFVVFRKDLQGVDAYTRHKALMASYSHYYSPGNSSKSKPAPNPELEILKKHHKFIRDDDDDDEAAVAWEQRVAKKYYDKLFKEYAICDLRYYKQGKIALRWRTEPEVVEGKGQFICASNRCSEAQAQVPLTSWEVNFGYVEDNVKKNELVKVRLCPSCSDMLNYKTMKRAVKSRRREEKRKRKEALDDDDNDGDDDEKRGIKDKDRSKRRKGDEKGDDDRDESLDAATRDASIWSLPVEQRREKTREEEIDDYLADLLQ
ncbi:folate-sensitive fragile site protein Fra10Ac1-domain-containing protein [Gongronella butleri]|nr:folate-sensitive fragile site protein Fra10Ac1-domain-containing protein [Gongronella butleri]